MFDAVGKKTDNGIVGMNATIIYGGEGYQSIKCQNYLRHLAYTDGGCISVVVRGDGWDGGGLMEIT